jgi:transcriptional regulator with XRE-family HTH domain
MEMPAKAKVQFRGPLHRALCEEWKAKRVALGLTQQDVADELGISQSAYNCIENGTASPTLTQIERVSKALKLKPSVVLAEAS